MSYKTSTGLLKLKAFIGWSLVGLSVLITVMTLIVGEMSGAGWLISGTILVIGLKLVFSAQSSRAVLDNANANIERSRQF